MSVTAYRALCIAFDQLEDEQRLKLASAAGWLTAALKRVHTDPEHTEDLIRAALRNVREVAGLREDFADSPGERTS